MLVQKQSNITKKIYNHKSTEHIWKSTKYHKEVSYDIERNIKLPLTINLYGRSTYMCQLQKDSE